MSSNPHKETIMSHLIFLQLENTQALYQKLKSEGRKDAIACTVLNRIENEIIDLKNKYDNEMRKPKSFKPLKSFINYILKKVVL